MNKTILLATVMLTCFINAKAQNEAYNNYIEQAMKLYDSKNYTESAKAFSKAFESNDGKGLMYDRYDAACSWSLAGNADSAFFQLFRIATKSNYTDLSHLRTDTDLEPLHADKRWEELCKIVKENKDKAEVNFNKPLVALLDSIYIDDQSGRMQIEGIEKQYGRDSKEMSAHWKMMIEKDSVNLLKIIKILDQYGWAGPEVVGTKGNQTLFLVIQHADIATQQKYLPMMREAVKNKKASASSLALLEDRVALRTGKKQIYGSQIGRFKDGKYYVSPLEDPDNVDKRRAEVGLEPLNSYIAHWNLTWDAEAYKKQLPEIEKYVSSISADNR